MYSLERVDVGVEYVVEVTLEIFGALSLGISSDFLLVVEDRN